MELPLSEEAIALTYILGGIHLDLTLKRISYDGICSRFIEAREENSETGLGDLSF